MHFHSYIYLPDTLTAHQRLAWQDAETRLGNVVLEAGWKPEDPYFVEGDIDLKGSDLPQHLRYSDEAHTWCHDCARQIQEAEIGRQQELFRGRNDLDEDQTRLLDKDASTFDWWDVEAFFGGLQSDPPFLSKCDVANSNDTCCSGCGATLDHCHDDHSFGETMDHYEQNGVQQVSVETIFCILMLMAHKPGDPAVQKVAQDALRTLKANGLYRHAEDSSVAAGDPVPSA